MEESQAKEKLLAEVAKLWPAAKGSVRRYGQKCKNINCEKCKSGERHPIWQITYYPKFRSDVNYASVLAMPKHSMTSR